MVEAIKYHFDESDHIEPPMEKAKTNVYEYKQAQQLEKEYFDQKKPVLEHN